MPGAALGLAGAAGDGRVVLGYTVAPAAGGTPPTATATDTVTPAPTRAPAFSDGDFETPHLGAVFRTYATGGAFGSWTVDSGSVDLIGTYWRGANFGAGDGTSGDQSVDMNGKVPGSIHQDFATTPGATYDVIFYLAGNPDGANARKTLTVSVGAPGDPAPPTGLYTAAKGSDYGHMGWTREALQFTACATCTTTRLTLSGDPGADAKGGAYGPVVDDIAIAPSASGSTATAQAALVAGQTATAQAAATGTAQAGQTATAGAQQTATVGAQQTATAQAAATATAQAAVTGTAQAGQTATAASQQTATAQANAAGTAQAAVAAGQTATVAARPTTTGTSPTTTPGAATSTAASTATSTAASTATAAATGTATATATSTSTSTATGTATSTSTATAATAAATATATSAATATAMSAATAAPCRPYVAGVILDQVKQNKHQLVYVAAPPGATIHVEIVTTRPTRRMPPSSSLRARKAATTGRRSCAARRSTRTATHRARSRGICTRSPSRSTTATGSRGSGSASRLTPRWGRCCSRPRCPGATAA